MKAIETKYKGYRFRSRLEARWAVFFDGLGLRWEYEPEGFDLAGADWYLPDFWIPLPGSHHPGAGYWIEIKRQGEPSAEEQEKVAALAKETGHNTILLAGNPWPGECMAYKFNRDGSYFCLPAFLEFKGHDGETVKTFINSYPSHAAQFAQGVNGHFLHAAEAAAIAARSARFEHGESGAAA